MKFVYEKAILTCDDKDVFDSETFEDVLCRLYLSQAPNKLCECVAKAKDGKHYEPNDFFIETAISKFNKDGQLVINPWHLFYVLKDGAWIEFGRLIDFEEELEGIDSALEFFKEDLEVSF